MHYSQLHRVKNINFNGQSKKTDFLCARLECIHLVHRYLRHHTYKGCLVMILGSHAEASDKIIATCTKNLCTPYLRLRRGVHHSKMGCSLWCTTVLSQSESRDSGSTSTKGNNFEDTYTYAWWVRTTSGQVRDGPLIIMGRGRTEISISLFFFSYTYLAIFFLGH